jgi:hypothetical protein
MQFANNLLIIAALLVVYYLLRIHWILDDSGAESNPLQVRDNHDRFRRLILREREPLLRRNYQRLLNGLYFSLLVLILSFVHSLWP